MLSLPPCSVKHNDLRQSECVAVIVYDLPNSSNCLLQQQIICRDALLREAV